MRRIRIATMAGGLAAALAVTTAPIQAQRFEIVTPFEYVMGEVVSSASRGIGAGLAARGQAQAFNAQIASARAAFAKCKGACTSERRALGQLLAKKDEVYLHYAYMRQSMGSMFGEAGVDRANAMETIMRGNSGYDGGIAPECAAQFNRWSSAYVSAFFKSGAPQSAMGAIFNNGGNPFASLGQFARAQVSADQALLSTKPVYEPYRACRDGAELKRAGRL